MSPRRLLPDLAPRHRRMVADAAADLERDTGIRARVDPEGFLTVTDAEWRALSTHAVGGPIPTDSPDDGRGVGRVWWGGVPVNPRPRDRRPILSALASRARRARWSRARG